MRHDIVITFRREKSRRNAFTGFCLLLFSLLAFALTSVRTNLHPVYPAAAAVVMIVAIVFTSLKARQESTPQFRYWLLAAAIGWALMPYGQWLLIIFAGFAIWERRAAVPLAIRFSTSVITINSFPERRIDWSTLHSVILKDGLLTLDFKNNRLLQREVSGEPDEAAFNAFVRVCLRESMTRSR